MNAVNAPTQLTPHPTLAEHWTWYISLSTKGELPRGDCFADSTPLGFNTLLQGAAHLGSLTGFACKSFSIVNPRGRELKALCRQL